MSALAIATVAGWDWSEVKECTYQPGAWTKPLYTFADSYWCATASQKAPIVRSRDGSSLLAGFQLAGTYKDRLYVWQRPDAIPE